MFDHKRIVSFLKPKNSLFLVINDKTNKPLTDFCELPFVEQAAIIWQKGRPVATRHLPDFRLHLYAVDQLYVEMWVCRRRFVVTLFRAITDTDDLLPYVDERLPLQTDLCTQSLTRPR